MSSDLRKVEEPPAKSLPLAHRAASGAIWIALEMSSTQALSLLIFAIMARYISPADFGLISISYIAIFTFKSLVIDNLVYAVIRKKDPSDLEYTTCFWLTFLFAAAAALLTFLLAGPAERLMHAPGLEDVMRAMSVILLFAGLSRTHEMRLSRLFLFRTLALRGILGAVLGGMIGVGLAARGYGLTALVVQQVATSGISLALLWASSSWRPSLRFSGTSAIEILLFMRGMAPASIVSVVSENCDTFLVAYFFGPASAGLYAIAKRVRLALQLVSGSPISGVVLSTLAEVQGNREHLKSVSKRMIALICFVCAPVFIGASSVAREVILIGFGDRWIAAGPVFAILALGGVFIALQHFSDIIFKLKNRQIWSFYCVLTHVVLAVPFFFLFSNFGPEYLAVPFVLPYLVAFPLAAVLVSRLTGLSSYEWLIAIAPSLVSSGIMFAAVKLTASNIAFMSLAPQVAICIFVGALSYFIAMLVLSRSTVVSAFRMVSNFVI